MNPRANDSPNSLFSTCKRRRAWQQHSLRKNKSNMSVDQVTRTFQEFKDAFEVNNLTKCSALLTELKIALTQFSFLLPGSGGAPSANALKEAVLAREILEYAVLLAVKERDTNAFARHVAQVKTYYFDTGDLFKGLPPSSRQYLILGLNLLRLLALNRIAEFHTELELIPLDQHENVYINHPIKLEQYIMEGAYSKVFKAANDVPSETYSYFIGYLIETRLRDDIAECSEKSYVSLPLPSACKVLNFNNSTQLVEYSKERGWNIANDKLHFRTAPKDKMDTSTSVHVEDEVKPIPSLAVITQTLAYAKELERIV